MGQMNTSKPKTTMVINGRYKLTQIWKRPWIISVLVFTVSIAATGYFQHLIKMREEQDVVTVTTENANRIRDLIEHQTQTNLRSIGRVAQRWDSANGTPSDQWHKDTANYVGQIPGLRIMEWVGPDNIVRWSQPTPGNKNVLGADVSANPQDAALLKRAIAEDSMTLGHQGDMVEGFKGFKLFVPVHKNGKFDGCISAAFDSQQYISNLLSKDILTNFSISLSQDNRQFFGYMLSGADENAGKINTLPIHLQGNDWVIKIVPSKAFLKAHESGLANVSIGIGLLISLLLSLSVRALLLASERAARLRVSEGKYRLLADNIPGMVAYWGKDQRCQFANQAFLESFGRTPKDMIGIQMSELLGGKLYDATLTYIPGALSGVRQGFESRLIKPSGEQSYVWAEYVPDLTEDGHILGFYVMVTDITAVKTKEIELAEANTLNNAVLQSTRYLVVATDLAGTVTVFNAAAEKALGYTVDEIVGKTSPAIWHDGDEIFRRTEALNEELGLSLEPGFSTFIAKADMFGHDEGEWTFIRKDGSRFPGVLNATCIKDPNGRTTGYLGVIEDISERRLTEEKYRLLIDGIADYAIYWLDEGGHVSSWNRGAQLLKGYTLDEIIGKHFSVFFTDEDRHFGLPQHALETAARDGKFEGEGWRVRKDGSTFWTHVLLEPIRDTSGNIVGYAKISHDETDRRGQEMERSKLIAIIEESPDFIGIADLQGNLQYHNAAARRLIGLAPDCDMSTLGISDMHPLWAFERVRDIGIPTVMAKGFWQGETALLHRDGHEVPVLQNLALHRDADGSPACLTTIMRDITELKSNAQALAASEETFRSAMEYASIGMALVAPDGRWLKVNRALTDLLGYSAEELLANDFQTITHPDDLDPDIAQVRRVLAGEIQSYTLEKRYFHRDGRLIWALLSASLVRDSEGRPQYFISQIMDITERKELDRMKTEFISIVSHELRTPLTSIRGSLGLMLGTMTDEMSEEATEYTTLAYNNCERLIGLINDILDIDKIAAGHMRFDFVESSVGALVAETVAANQAYASKYGVRIVTGSLPASIRVAVDSARFIQVLTNLISNAAKFSPEGGEVRVKATLADGCVRINVMDQGPGIPEEFRARIFGKFAQADSGLTRDNGGTGLGLHVAREMVRKMNGNIGFDSILGSGSTFWMEFPVVGRAQADQEVPSCPASTRLLLFSTDREAAMTISADLGAAGMAFDLCHDLIEARKCIEGQRYDAIVVSLSSASSAIDKALKGLAETLLPITLVQSSPDLSARTRRIVAELGLHFAPEGDHDLASSIRRDMLLRTARPQILHIEDDADFCIMLRGSLRSQADVTCVYDLRCAEAALRDRAFDLIILDLCLPDAIDIDWAAYISEHAAILPPVVTLSADTPSPALRHVTVANLMKSKVSERKIVEVVMKHAERKETQHG